MSDKQFESKLKTLHFSLQKHKKLLLETEDEYKRRYGVYPSEIDDDTWIDAFHYGNCPLPSLKEIDDSAKLHLYL